MTTLLGLRTVIYPAPDLEAAKAWWTRLLGFGPYFDEPFYVGFEAGGYELGLLPGGDPADGALTYWGVDDVAAAVVSAVALGATEHTPATEVGDQIVTATVKTPQGAVLGFIFNPHFGEASDPGDGAEPDLVPSERDVLLRYLHKMRDAVVVASVGLNEEEARTPGVPSGTNLLGIVQHLNGVEQHWFRLVFLGEDIACEMSMDVPANVSRGEVVAAYREACAQSDQIIRSHPDLSTLAAVANPGEDGLCSLRQITAHMIEETGRHAGQADILRELIDGTTTD